jgi:trehalose 6-phosphate phosphatase
MHYLLDPDGEQALREVLDRQPLLAFDFDGTLAPIVSHPDDARIAPAVAERLQRLAARRPVAIVTGRSVADVRGRLGFEPQHVVGNHGAEDELQPDAVQARGEALHALRVELQQRRPALAAAGVWVEDKGPSIALHYRLAPEREKAQALILDLLTPHDDELLRIFPGKMVVNVTSAAAPDKAQAMQALVARCGARSALFAGDDVNDEPVFVAAPPHWLTVRIGPDLQRPSRARFYLHGPEEIGQMLDRLLALA